VLPAGFLLSLNAFQADTLFALVLAVITSADPLLSIIIGATLLHETIASAPLELAGEAIALAVMVGGIVILAHCTPHPAQEMSGAPGMARRARITSDGSAAASGRRGPAEHGSRAERPVRPRAMAAGLAREQLTAPEPGTSAAQRRGRPPDGPAPQVPASTASAATASPRCPHFHATAAGAGPRRT
jgi:hypothetical protein